MTNAYVLALVAFGRFASSLYMHELALHVNHNIEEFKAPFFAKSLESCHLFDTNDPSSSHLSMLREMALAAHGLLDTFIHLSILEMLALPPHIYGGRLIYAAIILMKLDRASRVSASRWNGSIPVDHPRLETRIDQLLVISKRLLMTDERSSLSRAFLIMPQLKVWLHAQEPEATCTLHEGSTHGGLFSKHGQWPLVPSAQTLPTVHTPTGSHNGSSAEMQIPLDIALDCSDLLGEDRSQLDSPVAQIGSAESKFEQSKFQLASDSWFWEFLNADMTH